MKEWALLILGRIGIDFMDAVRGQAVTQDSQIRTEKKDKRKNPEGYGLWDASQLPFTGREQRMMRLYKNNKHMRALKKRMIDGMGPFFEHPFFFLESKQQGHCHIVSAPDVISSSQPRFPVFHHCTPAHHNWMNSFIPSLSQVVDMRKVASGALLLGMYSGIMFSIYLGNIEKPGFIKSIFLSLMCSSGLLLIKNSSSVIVRERESTPIEKMGESGESVQEAVVQMEESVSDS